MLGLGLNLTYKYVNAVVPVNNTTRAFDINGNVRFEESSDIIPNNWTSSNSAAVISIDFKSTLESIGNVAFGNCTNLTNVIIPNSVTNINNYVFVNCTNLTNVIIPNNVTYVGEGIFANCTSLNNVIIPNSVTNIGNYMFTNCISLNSIIIPNSVTNIGEGAFNGCEVLNYIACLAAIAPTIENSVFSNILTTEIHVPVGATGYGTTFGGLTVIYDL